MGGRSAGEDGAGGGCTVEGASGISCCVWDGADFWLWLDCGWPDCARAGEIIRMRAAIRTSRTAASGARPDLNHNHRTFLPRSTIRPLLLLLILSPSGRFVEKNSFPTLSDAQTILFCQPKLQESTNK